MLIKKLAHLAVFSCISLTSFNGFSANLSSFCSNGEDCPNGFYDALMDSMNKGEPLIVDINEVTIPRLDIYGGNFDRLVILSSNNVTPTIKTDGFNIFDISNVSLSGLKFEGINYEEGSTQQEGSIVSIKGSSDSNRISNIKIEDVSFKYSAENLLSIFNADNVFIKASKFQKAGLAMRIESDSRPNDPRPKGSAVTFLNVNNLIFSSNKIREVKKNGVYLAAKDKSFGYYFYGNDIDLRNYSQPTERYGLYGATGIYFDQSNLFEDILVVNNYIKNFQQNAMRINGSRVSIVNNKINTINNDCSIDSLNYNKNVFHQGDAAFKAHYVSKLNIMNNCISKSKVGVQLESWDEMNNVIVDGNLIINTYVGISLEDLGKGYYGLIRFSDNIILGSRNHALAIRPSQLVKNLSIYNNTISNGNPRVNNKYYRESEFAGPSVIIKNQNGLYFGNNWIEGVAVTSNWTHLDIHNVNSSNFFNNSFKTPTGDDRTFGGINIRNSSVNNHFDGVNLFGLLPGIHGGDNNEIINVKYE